MASSGGIALGFEDRCRALAQKVDRALTGVVNRRARVKRPRSPPPSAPAPPLYKAFKNYLAKDPIELSLSIEEPVTIIRKNSDDYWECSNVTEKSGLVPSNALREEAPAPTPPPPPPPRKALFKITFRIPIITGMRYDEDYLKKYGPKIFFLENCSTFSFFTHYGERPIFKKSM
ncbi:uncharacterized protein RSE6_10071 [Rhynchosporium secalis]|uniref:SH3 domain-containing protein n=1 Tax=Rhynchosporium secalis TaxID=38038 RepID=A0A1E1MJK3_RHYSE|nr:uncharacterized protein RSE6_10071 [Rhynchosporium secalis]